MSLTLFVAQEFSMITIRNGHLIASLNIQGKFIPISSHVNTTHPGILFTVPSGV